MKKESRTKLMHHVGPGKRQSLADEASQPLSQGVVPALDVSRLTGFFATGSMLFVGDDLVVGLPEIRVAMTRSISSRDRFPQLPTGLLTAVADDTGDHLAGRPAERDPHESAC